MEAIIIICLLIIIALLLHDKIYPKKQADLKANLTKNITDLPDIIGKPKTSNRLALPNITSKFQHQETEKEADNFDIEIREEEIDASIPKVESAEKLPDLEEEEEELRLFGLTESDNGFATGVTFDELGTVEQILRLEKLEAAQKETAVAIVQKIQGTDLFSLLESSIENVSQKIAALLDNNIPGDYSQDSFRKNDVDDFNIREFI
ncbi:MULTISPECIES: conjugal transfer protein TraD [Sphingobacterium]|uniref:conjugal transfer protein TraD n=1 Tax=Sphingobacterium TaxID=28453 RepID=UPI000DB0A571|nr:MULTISPECIES: conjugal transfer protein TraD [Sphingobacterium]PZU25981.1 MAG: conjugal transfer protein TraD [Chryseobacterium sp.]